MFWNDLVLNILVILLVLMISAYILIGIKMINKKLKNRNTISEKFDDYRGVPCDLVFSFQHFLWWLKQEDHDEKSHHFTAYCLFYKDQRIGFIEDNDAVQYQQWLQEHTEYLYRGSH